MRLQETEELRWILVDAIESCAAMTEARPFSFRINCAGISERVLHITATGKFNPEVDEADRATEAGRGEIFRIEVVEAASGHVVDELEADLRGSLDFWLLQEAGPDGRELLDEAWLNHRFHIFGEDGQGRYPRSRLQGVLDNRDCCVLVASVMAPTLAASVERFKQLEQLKGQLALALLKLPAKSAGHRFWPSGWPSR